MIIGPMLFKKKIKINESHLNCAKNLNYLPQNTCLALCFKTGKVSVASVTSPRADSLNTQLWKAQRDLKG